MINRQSKTGPSKKKARLIGFVFFFFGLTACGESSNSEIAKIAIPTPEAKETATVVQDPYAAAGRYTTYAKSNPLPDGVTAYDPPLLYYSLRVNCSRCHDWVDSLSSVKSRLKKNKAIGSIQDRISSGSMPINSPTFAKSDAGKELLDLLNNL